MDTKFILDKAGFPMIWVDKPLSAYIHWLPITKIQFEVFMCDSPSSDFSDTWYREVLALNPRVSPKVVTKKNYWNSLLTGIKPSEAENYANWCAGDEDEWLLPSLEDWNFAYKALKQLPPLKDPFKDITFDSGAKMAGRVELLLGKFDAIVESLHKEKYSLADQMFMRYGVMEWVQHESRGQHEWAGMGQPITGLQAILRTPESAPQTPKNSTSDRFHYYGFRLIKR